MTVDQLVSLQGDGFISARPRDPATLARQALAHVAATAMANGDLEGYRQVRAQLRLVPPAPDSNRVLSERDARELNSIVALVDTPADIDWGTVYDDDDL